MALLLSGCGGGSLVGEFQQNAPPAGGTTATIGGSTAIVPPPTIGSVTPSTGDSSGGTAITLTGANFQAGAIVLVGGKPATSVVVTGGSTITAITAPNAPGTYAVQVINPDKQIGARLGSFTYLAAPAPTLLQVQPNNGPASGGSVVNLFGANYQAGAVVLFGGAAATSVTLISAVQLQVTTPGVAPGIVDVQVINPDSQTVTLTGGFTYSAAPGPTIISVSPGFGPSSGGTTVNIDGTSFALGTTVQFGGVPATNIIVNGPTQLTVTTPQHSIGVTDVVVRNPDNQTATRASAFNFVPPPGIKIVSPNSGPLAGGTVVTITGSDFQGGASVTFGGTLAASVNVQGIGLIQATTPAHAAGTVDVVVTNFDGQTGTLTGGFTFNLGPAPSITCIGPAPPPCNVSASGPVGGGTNVVITGTNFQAGAAIAFGAFSSASATVNSLTQITATTPAASAGVVDVTVTNTDGQVGTLTSGFNFLPAPTVASISPNTGPTSGGTAVVITGTNFQAGATVQFGSAAPIPVTFSSSTVIQATSPLGAAGAVDVTVKNPDNQTGTLAGGFTYSAAPFVISVTPSTGPIAGGTPVTISGKNFVSGATVAFCVAPCSSPTATGVVFNTPSSITAVSPLSTAAGAVDVTVTNPSGLSGTLPLAFTYAPPPPPNITLVNPTFGAAFGGTPITIDGTGFLAGATVTIGGTAATGVQVLSAGQISAVTPAPAPACSPPLPLLPCTVNVVVTNADGQFSPGFGYTYNPAPTVTSVAASSGPTSGGTVVIVNGNNFQTGATILFGNTPATGLAFLNANQYQATTPAVAAAGSVSVRVTNADGQSDILATAFTYTAAPPPTVVGVSPGSGPANGGTTITITGTDFVAGAAVLVGGGAATNVVVTNSAQIVADTQSHAAGTVLVQVRNPDTQVSSSIISPSNSFTFVAAPTIISVSPNSGSTAGGTPITITGTAFDSLATVSIGGISASNVVFVSTTSITAVTPAGSAGPASVVVLNPPDGQVALLNNGFTYIAPAAAPIVTSVLPINGSQNGGTTVTITGTGFLPGATVAFCVAPCSSPTATGVVVNSPSSITAVTPAGTPGLAVDVQVTNTDSQFGSLPSAFAYLISSVVVATDGLPEGNLQIPYTIGFAAVGGVPLYSWTFSAGTLPPGLALDANTGFLDGVPTQTGSFSFTVVVADKATPSAQTATANFTLDIVPVPSGPNLPQFPQVFINTTFVPPTGNLIRVAAGASFQTALNTAKCGDTILLASGATFTGNFKLPNTTDCSGNAAGLKWIVIRTDTANLPPQGTRIVPATYAPVMAKLVSAFNTPAVAAIANNANSYWIMGVEITVAASVTANSLLVQFGGFQSSLATIPHHFVVDRCYIHGTTRGDMGRGITLNAATVAVVDSYISDIHKVGTDTAAVSGTTGPGPFKIVNNYLEAAGENVIFGGADPNIVGLVYSDIEIRRNHFFKPLTWRVGDPSYLGIHFSVKNLFEIKNGQRILMENNILEYSWADGQVGFAVLFTPKNQNGGCTQCVVQDVVFRNNLVQHAASGINIGGTNANCPGGCFSLPSNRILVKDNVFDDINGPAWGGSGDLYQIAGPDPLCCGAGTGPPFDIHVDHNTGFHTRFMVAAGNDALATMTGFIYTNNITPHVQGIKGSGVGVGNATLSTNFPGSLVTKNVMVNGPSASYPAGNFFPTSMTAVGFVDFSLGDYRLTPTSPFSKAGTDGKDVGAFVSGVKSAIAGVP